MLNYLRSLRAAQRSMRMPDAPRWQLDILAAARPFTMAGDARTLSTVAAIDYLVRHAIKGAIVECGVWRGGQMMAAALTLLRLGVERDIYLFDTFAGMTRPGSRDVDRSGVEARAEYSASMGRPVGRRWCEAGIEDVRRNLAMTGYPARCIHLVQGDVAHTIPEAAPAAIAYLRLDTDWYESTAHELEHLYPRVSRLGVVTIDDYGHWMGARQATDEYIEKQGIVALMHRIDDSARQFVKV